MVMKSGHIKQARYILVWKVPSVSKAQSVLTFKSQKVREERPLKADPHVACHAHSVPMPYPCHAPTVPCPS